MSMSCDGLWLSTLNVNADNAKARLDFRNGRIGNQSPVVQVIPQAYVTGMGMQLFILLLHAGS